MISPSPSPLPLPSPTTLPLQDYKKAFQCIKEKLKASPHIELSQIPLQDSKSHHKKWLEALITTQLTEFNPSTLSRIQSEFLEEGPLKKLFQDPKITEIIVNGPFHIYYEISGHFYKYEDQFLSLLTFQNFIQRLCDHKQALLSLNTPCVDFNYKNFRVHIIQPPLSQKKTCLSLRRHPENPWCLQSLKEAQWATEFQIQKLKELIHLKKSLLIVGETGTGKTSVLNACLQELSPYERVVSIEDTPEISLPNAFSSQLLTRQKEDDIGLQEYSQGDLLKQALRMRLTV